MRRRPTRAVIRRHLGARVSHGRPQRARLAARRPGSARFRRPRRPAASRAARTDARGDRCSRAAREVAAAPEARRRARARGARTPSPLVERARARARATRTLGRRAFGARVGRDADVGSDAPRKGRTRSSGAMPFCAGRLASRRRYRGPRGVGQRAITSAMLGGEREASAAAARRRQAPPASPPWHGPASLTWPRASQAARVGAAGASRWRRR